MFGKRSTTSWAAALLAKKELEMLISATISRLDTAMVFSFNYYFVVSLAPNGGWSRLPGHPPRCCEKGESRSLIAPERSLAGREKTRREW
jgi:hypothetical protein